MQGSSSVQCLSVCVDGCGGKLILPSFLEQKLHPLHPSPPLG